MCFFVVKIIRIINWFLQLLDQNGEDINNVKILKYVNIPIYQ